MISRRLSTRLLAPLFSLVGALSLHAHHLPPHLEEVDEFEHESFRVALSHPFSGADHLTAALAVGALAFVLGRKAGLKLSASFVGAIAGGFALGQAQFALPMLEPGLALSVVAAGILLMTASKANPGLCATIVAAIGFWHGNAHGNEMHFASAGMGLVAGSALLVALGAAFARLATSLVPSALRIAGAAAAVVGLFLCIVRLA